MSRNLGYHAIVIASLLLSPITAAVSAQDYQTVDEPLEDTLGDVEYELELEPGEIEYFEPELIRDTADDVFDAPEFRALPRLDLGDGAQNQRTEPELAGPSGPATSGGGGIIGGGFADFLRELFGGAATALIALLILLLVGGLLAGILLVARTWRGRNIPASPDDASDDDEPAPLVSPGAQPPDAWLAAARQAAAAGRFEEAVSLLLLGAMGHAELAGLIRPRRGLTYRDYLRVVPRASAWHPALERLIRTYAPIGFGRRSASEMTFREVVAPYETALASEPIADSASEHSPQNLSTLNSQL